MTQKQFIELLVKEKVCSQYEAEQYTYPCGTNEWCFLNESTKNHASSNEDNTISIYKFNPVNQTHNKCLINAT